MINFHTPQIKEDIYHYTSENGIMGILQKDEVLLWLTKADSLNDRTEGKDIFEHLLIVCKDLLNNKQITQEQYSKIAELKNKSTTTFPVICIESIKSTIEHKPTKLLEKAYYECDIYTMSFCKEKDYLPMWNYYGSSEKQGYCLHFNSENLKDFIEGKVYWTEIKEIIYNDDEKQKLLKKIILESINHDDYLKKISLYIDEYKYFMKNKCFEYEKEVRLLFAVPKNDNDTFDIKFRVNHGTIIPYIEVPITNILAITGITIGPFADMELMKRNLEFYTDSIKSAITTKIEETKIPIRF